MNSILTIVTFFPLLGVAVILLLKPLRRESDDLIKRVAVAASVITFLISLAVLFSYDRGQAGLRSAVAIWPGWR
jgi:NADH:ubiquinone oxidoreductase subunit 4 (subunit M)